MKLHHGLRKADIARRETGIVSWLDFRQHMTGKELADLFSEWATGPCAYPARMLTQLALDNLIVHGAVEATTIESKGIGFQVFRLASRSVAEGIDPNTVELTPREIVLMGFMSRPNEPQTAAVLDQRMGQAEPDSWRTEACLGHLANLGLLHAVASPPGAYKLA